MRALDDAAEAEKGVGEAPLGAGGGEADPDFAYSTFRWAGAEVAAYVRWRPAATHHGPLIPIPGRSWGNDLKSNK